MSESIGNSDTLKKEISKPFDCCSDACCYLLEVIDQRIENCQESLFNIRNTDSYPDGYTLGLVTGFSFGANICRDEIQRKLYELLEAMHQASQ